jgi:TM2 domain-containing membrane protein YozV
MVADANYCKECGAALTLPLSARGEPVYIALVAFALSFVPGLGHLYRGRLGRAILWFFAVAVAYTLAYPLGVMVHIVCALNAALKGVFVPDSRAVARSGPRA